MSHQLNTRTISYRPDIDGLRAIAISIVLAFHYFPQIIPGGYLGVDIFLVISGYLITQILLTQKNLSIKEFYARRIARLVPALVVILLFSLAVGWFVLLPSFYMKLGKHIVAGAGFFSNITYLKEVGYFDVGAHSKILLHLWSLGVEMQFYLVWSIILIALIKYRISILIAIIVLLLTSLIIFYSRINHYVGGAFYLLDARGWQLLVGALVAYLESKRYQSTHLYIKFGNFLPGLGFLGIFSSLVFTEHTQNFNFYGALLAAIGSGLVIFSPTDNWLSRSILSRPAFTIMGKLSYPLYLWHWPILVFSLIYWGSELPNLNKIILILVSIFLAFLTYQWVEPIFRISKGKSKSTVLKVGFLIIVLILLGVLGHYVFKNKGLVDRLGYSKASADWVGVAQDDFKWGLHVRSGYCHIQSTKSSDVKSNCIEKGGNDLLILWGDSYASSLYPGIIEHQKSNQSIYRVGQLTSAGCPPYLGVKITDHRKNCDEINKKSIDLIESSNPKWLLIHANFRDPRNHLSLSEELLLLGKTIDRIKSIKNPPTILLVGQVPIWKKDLLQLLSELVLNDLQHGLPKSYLDVSYLNENIWEMDAHLLKLSKHHGVKYLSPLTVFCNKDKSCMTRVGETPLDALSIDSGHLSSSAARFLIKELFQSIKFK
jgi:peptidoglycan/LPS O-acetylase OafA/YrhL